jgi:hypothetical protein
VVRRFQELVSHGRRAQEDAKESGSEGKEKAPKRKQ